MASPSRRKPAASNSVFVNCPFDDRIVPILRAMVVIILAAADHPRRALDAKDDAGFIGKIAQTIAECDWVIRDLSRVEVEGGGVPRFNRPMELGLHLGARILGEKRHRRKRALILDAERHRYDQALSDISGQDIESHGNDPDEAIRCVRNWLSEHQPRNAEPLPGAAAIQADYRRFQTEVRALLAPCRLDPDALTHSDYLFAVGDWLNAQAANA